MATVEHDVTPHAGNGAAPTGAGIPVENPATGEVVGTVPALSAADVEELAARARLAQPAWEAIGFEGRARDAAAHAEVAARQRRARHRDDRLGDRQDLRGRAAAELVLLALSAFGFWAKEAPKYLADEHVKSASPHAQGQEARRPLRARSGSSA